jgi:hypothetical protein
MKTRCVLKVILMAALLVVSVQRSPAPISEVETPTPTPKIHSAPSPDEHRKSDAPKHKIREKQQEATTSKPVAKSSRNPFDGTWRGFLHIADYTLLVSESGTAVTEQSTTFGTFSWRATCDGNTMRWYDGGHCAWTFTPTPDGKTASVAASCPGILGLGSGSWSATFRRAQ